MVRPQRPHRTRPVSSARPPRAGFRSVRFCMWAFSEINCWFASDCSQLIYSGWWPRSSTFHAALGLLWPVVLRAPVHDARAVGRPAEHIGAGVDGVAQNLQHRVVGRRPPLDFADLGVAAHGRKLQPGVLQPQHDLAGAAEFPELPQHQPDRIGHALVGVDLDLP